MDSPAMCWNLVGSFREATRDQRAKIAVAARTQSYQRCVSFHHHSGEDSNTATGESLFDAAASPSAFPSCAIPRLFFNDRWLRHADVRIARTQGKPNKPTRISDAGF